MSQSFKDQLDKWQRLNNKQQQPKQAQQPRQATTQQPRPLITVEGHIGKARKMFPYVAVVTHPMSKGGGTLWYKNLATAKKYESMAGYKVEWL